MTYSILILLHFIGMVLIGGGLLTVFLADLRSRQAQEWPVFAESVRLVAIAYDGLVVPGAIVLAASGTWLIVAFHGGWAFLEQPWLAGMVALFLFEFIEGNTVTRRAFLRMRQEVRRSEEQGQPTEALLALRASTVPTFTHGLDLPILLVIVSLGAMRPETWTHFFVGTAIALTLAAGVTVALSRMARSAVLTEPQRGGW